jgi:hypothetical protein
MRYLWMIERKAGTKGYDENVSCIVVASTEEEVRAIAARNAADEGEGPWHSPETLVTQLGIAHEDVGVTIPIVMISYNAG